MCDATRFRVRIGTQEMPESWRWLSQQLSLVLPESGGCRLKLEIPATLPDWKKWRGGEPIVLWLGYADEMLALFEGELTGIHAQRDMDGAQWVSLIARDKLHRLGRSHQRRLFEKTTEGQLFSKLARPYGLRTQIQDPGELLPSILQANQTDLALLQARVERLGCIYWLEKGTLHIAPQRPAGETLPLKTGNELKHLETWISATRTPTQMSVFGHELKQGRRVLGRARAAQVKPTEVGKPTGAAQVSRAFGQPELPLNTVPVNSAREAQTVAKGQLTRELRQIAVARGTCAGMARLKPGCLLNLEGVPPLSAGRWEVCSTEHVLDGQGGYVTHFEARRNTVAA